MLQLGGRRRGSLTTHKALVEICTTAGHRVSCGREVSSEGVKSTNTECPSVVKSVQCVAAGAVASVAFTSCCCVTAVVVAAVAALPSHLRFSLLPPRKRPEAAFEPWDSSQYSPCSCSCTRTRPSDQAGQDRLTFVANTLMMTGFRTLPSQSPSNYH